METQLARNGCGVLHAYNGTEALRVIENNDIDLVILDVEMPNLDGFQTLERLSIHGMLDTFTIVFDYLASTGETETASVESLLINSVSEADEIMEEIRILASPETSVILGEHPITIPELQHIAKDLPMSLLSLIVEMQGAVKENMVLVRLGLTKDMIVLAKQVENSQE